MHNLDINLLRAFVAIAEESSLTGAGQRLFRTQSTVSLQLKRLERMLNERLMERTQGRVLGLTPAGEKFLGHARRIVQANDEALATVGAPELEGVVRLGVPDESAHAKLARGLQAFRTRHSRVRIEVVCRLSGELDRLLERGKIDLALINRCDSTPGPEDLRVESLKWLASTALLWTRDEPVPLVGFPPGCPYRTRAIEALDNAGVDWIDVYSSTSYYGVWTAVSAGLGVAALPEISPLSSPMSSLYEPGLPRPDPVVVGLSFASGAKVEIVTCLREHIREWFLEPLTGG